LQLSSRLFISYVEKILNLEYGTDVEKAFKF